MNLAIGKAEEKWSTFVVTEDDAIILANFRNNITMTTHVCEDRVSLETVVV